LLIAIIFVMLCLFGYHFFTALHMHIYSCYHAYIGYEFVPLHTTHYTLNIHNINFRLDEEVTVPPMALV
jgi:hypothetical protein